MFEEDVEICKGLVTNFYVLLKHHGFVGDVTILIETRLALLLLGGNVVGDEGVVALLTEGVLALHLLLVDGLLHLHQLLDAPHVLLLLLGGLLLLPGVQLGLLGGVVSLRVGAGVGAHRVSELVEENSVISAASDLARHRGTLVSLRLLLSVLVVVVVVVVVLLLLLSLLEILLLLEVAVGLLVVVVKLILLFVVELLGLLGLNVPHGAGLRPLGVVLQTEVVLLDVVLALILLGQSVFLGGGRGIFVVKIIVDFLNVIIVISYFGQSFLQVSQECGDVFVLNCPGFRLLGHHRSRDGFLLHGLGVSAIPHPGQEYGSLPREISPGVAGGGAASLH